MKKMAYGFIFDLDGVLTATSEYHYLAWKRIANELGIPFDREKNEAFKGVSRRDCLLLLLDGRELPEDKIEELLERKNSYYREYLKRVGPGSLFPGVLPLFRKIWRSDGKIAVASVSKNTREIVKRLGIEEIVDVILDGYSVERTKPAPDQFLLAARMFEIPPERCAVFEDSKAGITAARSANMLAVGIGSPEVLTDADMVFEEIGRVDFESLRERIEKRVVGG